ncbi:MAG: rhodanese-like domain-containing protein [Bacteroidetes bacterium]|nr:MAG: rhodanese-like domain-containing protein [Bacteroidota bacterium]
MKPKPSGIGRLSRWELLKAQLNNLCPEEFQRMYSQDQGVVLLDVRRPEEFCQGHLPGARNLDYLGERFYDELDALDPERTYLVYCRSGRRSLRTCILMQNAGFRRVFNLDGGLRALEQSLQPLALERGPKRS